MAYNIWIDDLRATPEGFDLTFKTARAFITYLTENPNLPIGTLSLDHDLQDVVDGVEMTGYDLLKTILSEDFGINPTLIQAHTDNSVGFRNMILYALSAKAAGVITSKINPYKVKWLDGDLQDLKQFNWLTNEEVRKIEALNNAR